MVKDIKVETELLDLDITYSEWPDWYWDMLDRSIECQDLSVRSYYCLKKVGICSIDDLGKFTKSEILKIKNIGPKSLEEIERKMHAWGVKFLDEI